MKNIIKYLIILIIPFMMGSCFILVHDGCYHCDEELYHPEDAIDLGLSVAWASSNVGAEDLLKSGDYFAWGDTVVKDEYVKANYSIRHSKDIALSKLGGNWRMPSLEEVNELVDRCKVVKTIKDEVEGVEFIARNGNSIFFPKTGYKDSVDIIDEGIPMFWIYETNESVEAYSVVLKDTEEEGVDVLITSKARYLGIPVRAVWSCKH